MNGNEKALELWQFTRREKHVITCSQKYGKLATISKWLMGRDIPYWVDDTVCYLDDEVGYKIHLNISEAELAGLDEFIGKGSFVYVE